MARQPTARRTVGPTDRIVFSANPDGTYDLLVNGRTRAYDLDAEEFRSALRRLRVGLPREVYVEDTSGYAERVRISR